jgi:hypothetical protein
MPPELAPIIELRAWYEGHSVKHKHLAQSLNLSPQQLAELFSGRNQPTGTQVLTIIEFLRTNNMTVDQPKTLTAALDRIEVLTAELKELKATKATTLPPVTVQKPPAVPVTLPNAPATSQTPANPPASERPLASLSKREIADRMDDANARGDKAETNKLWREYCARK